LEKEKTKTIKINIHTHLWSLGAPYCDICELWGLDFLEFVMGFPAEAISYKKICPSGQDKNNKETLKLIFDMPICLLHCC
jgi:uncharacterized protein (DUF486 family)